MLKSLIGNGSKERDLTDEMRAVLQEIRQERGQCEALAKSARASVTRAQELGEPIAKAASEMDALTTRLATLEQRLGAYERVATQFQTLDERAERLAQSQRQADTRVARAGEETQRIRSLLEQLTEKVEHALGLKDQLETFLEMEKPLQALRGDADALRTQVDGTVEQLGRLREQHERVMDAYKAAGSRVEAFDRRHEDLARAVKEEERRVGVIEQTLRQLADVEQTAEDAVRRLGTAKALGDAVTQKISVLEGQHDSVERAIARADQLDKAMRQLDEGLRQQQENAAALGTLEEQVSALLSLHGTVAQRSRELDEVERESAERIRGIRSELTSARDELQKSVERFDFERSGLESVNQRVTDLRSALTDFEARFSGLEESSRSVEALEARTQELTAQLQNTSSEVARLDEERARVDTVRRSVEEVGKALQEARGRVTSLERARPTIEAALRDFEQLRGADAMVKDALEQARVSAAEIARVREEQGETRSWLSGVEQMLGELKEGVDFLQKQTPAVESLQKQLSRVNESLSTAESRREFAEGLHRRLAELGALGAQLDDRSRDLQVRMEAAEKRFVALADHAAEAERLGSIMGTVSAGLVEAERDAGAIAKKLAQAEARCESVEALSERTRALREELDQRQNALDEAARDLQRASELRQSAAAAAHDLGERAASLSAALAAADSQVTRVASLSDALEERSAGLGLVEKRVGQFEERLASFEQTEQDLHRSLEQISARQGTIDALRGDIERMFAIAEKTASDVRTITAAQGEIEQSRTLLDDLLGRMRDLRSTTTQIEQRKRQMDQAEERLARAEALLIDIRSSLDLLTGQKIVVDHAVEKAGTLRFLLKQAEVMIEELREERDVAARVRAAIGTPQPPTDGGESDSKEVAIAG